MSDFLSSLVDRALGRGPVLQRRRASFFEPTTDAIAIDVPLSIEPQPAEVSARMTGAGAPPAALEPASSARAQVAASSRETSSAVQRPSAEHAASSVPREGPPEPRTPSAPVQAVPPRGVETIVERVVERAGRPGVAEGSRVDPSQIRSAPTTLTVRSVPTVADGAIASGPMSVPGSREASSRREAPALRELPVPRIEPSGEPQAPRVVPRPELRMPEWGRDAAPPAPTIQVTIGRIEIRAMPSPTAPARGKGPAAPRLSLEDYLRLRGGGAR